MVDRTKFQEFDAVMCLYVNYKHSQKAGAPTHQARNVSALQVVEVVGKAVGDVGEVDEVHMAAA